MATTTAVEFTQIARALMAEARRLGLTVPTFRSPCRNGVRSIRRYSEGVVVRVTHQGRDAHEVTRDLIDGVLAAQSGLDKEMVETMRNALWVAAGEAIQVPA